MCGMHIWLGKDLAAGVEQASLANAGNATIELFETFVEPCSKNAWQQIEWPTLGASSEERQPRPATTSMVDLKRMPKKKKLQDLVFEIGMRRHLNWLGHLIWRLATLCQPHGGSEDRHWAALFHWVPSCPCQARFWACGSAWHRRRLLGQPRLAQNRGKLLTEKAEMSQGFVFAALGPKWPRVEIGRNVWQENAEWLSFAEWAAQPQSAFHVHLDLPAAPNLYAGWSYAIAAACCISISVPASLMRSSLDPGARMHKAHEEGRAWGSQKLRLEP